MGGNIKNNSSFPQAKQKPEWQQNMPAISTVMSIIKFENLEFSADKITETTYLSPLNNHKLEHICPNQDFSWDQISCMEL